MDANRRKQRRCPCTGNVLSCELDHDHKVKHLLFVFKSVDQADRIHTKKMCYRTHTHKSLPEGEWTKAFMSLLHWQRAKMWSPIQNVLHITDSCRLVSHYLKVIGQDCLMTLENKPPQHQEVEIICF